MPKEHFDCGAICQAALDVPLGIHVSTNHPAGFRRIMYKHMRSNPEHKLSILQSPASPNRFMLVRAQTYEDFQHGATA